MNEEGCGLSRGRSQSYTSLKKTWGTDERARRNQKNGESKWYLAGGYGDFAAKIIAYPYSSPTILVNALYISRP